MAFVARLPRREIIYSENHYGSKLHLRINPDNKCCDGTYEPIESEAAVSDQEEADQKMKEEIPGEIEMKPAQVGVSTPMPGHAILFGRIKNKGDEANEFIVKGEWKHVQGPLGGGEFEMLINSEGRASGWWIQEGGENRTPWQWSKLDQEAYDQEAFNEPFIKEENNDDHVIQTSSTTIVFRRSLSRRMNRGKSYFDEMLDQEGASSVMIARWGVFCGWIFALQTAVSLSFSSLQVSGEWASMMSLVFQGVYTLTYTSFLIIYANMKVRPPLDYTFGVTLYTFGYACFLALYIVGFVALDQEATGLITQLLYTSGSFLFLSGSILLVLATRPPPVPMVTRKVSVFDRVRHQYSMMDQQSSLFWGSITFLLGSCLFLLDSSWSLVHAESKPEGISLIFCIAGYSFFTVGRFYFLWGSTTADCNLFFLSGSGDVRPMVLLAHFKAYLFAGRSLRKVSALESNTLSRAKNSTRNSFTDLMAASDATGQETRNYDAQHFSMSIA